MKKKLLLSGLTFLLFLLTTKAQTPTPGDGNSLSASGQLTNILVFTGGDFKTYDYYFVNVGDKNFEKEEVLLEDVNAFVTDDTKLPIVISTNYTDRSKFPSLLYFKYKFIKKAKNTTTVVGNPVEELFPFSRNDFKTGNSKTTVQIINLTAIFSDQKPTPITPPIKPNPQP